MTTLAAVIDSSVIQRAIWEGLRNRGLPLEPFPPADPRTRATSVLATALNADLLAAGVRVTTTETLVTEALRNVEERLSLEDQVTFDKVEGTLWAELDTVIDWHDPATDPADMQSPLGTWTAEAVRLLDADVLITARDDHLDLADGVGSPAIVSMAAWLAVADEELRRARDLRTAP